MKIDITSMFFNSKIEGQTATAAWCTSIGQNKTRECRIDDFRQDVVDMVIGMTYKSVTDLDKLDISKGSSDREIVTCSFFDDVYINNKKIENGHYVLLLVREHSKSHEGRLLISYAPYIQYNGFSNQSCINLMLPLLECSSDGCWFVYDISIKNQSELYFSAVVVNATAPMIYSNSIKSKHRSEEWKALIPASDDYDNKIQKESNACLQQIYFGAPGTGKSFEINRLTKNKEVIRTTFHPDSDYSTFVGAYKPTSIEVPVRDVTGKVIIENGQKVTENRIVYEFVEQAFLQAYIKAWDAYTKVADGETPEEQYLVIEEINRGNCAQIFGDLFQLLDRNKLGFSDYPIHADKDMKKQLSKAFSGKSIANASRINNIYEKDIVSMVLNGDVLLLPDNLYIWATMNTSDQSLFPIDSAFKRRWEWKYMPICEGMDNGISLGWKIKVNDKLYDWWQFVDKINSEIDDQIKSEDKKLGYFFCKAPDGIISADTFVSKVIFYLWNDVFKDQDFGSDIFRDGEETLSFKSFFDVTANGKSVVNENKVELFLQNLEVPSSAITASNEANEGVETEVSDEKAESQRKETLISISIPNNPQILSSDSTQFDAFVKALRIIGIDKIIPIVSSLKYKRLNCPVLTTQKDSIIDNNNGYSYQQEGDLYIVKGCKNYTYIRILEDLNQILNIGLTLETK